MSKELVISASSHERRVAILEEGQLVEIYIEREKEFALVGSIYKGKVTRVLPGMQSAFVDIGLDGDAFLYVSDVFENLEDYDHGHEHASASPAIAGGAPIEMLPGESLAHVSGAHHEAANGEAAPGEEPRSFEGASEEGDFRPEAGHADARGEAEEDIPHTYDERQPESNASAPQNFGPSYNPTQKYPSRQERGGGQRGNDFRRGSGGGGGGGRGRWGRRGGRRHGRGPGGPGGRNLPPSKYAAPQGDRDQRGNEGRYENRGYQNRGPNRGNFERRDRGGYEQRGYDNRRPEDSRSAGPGPASDDDIVLPGESLAKYRGRPSAAPQAPVEEDLHEAQPPVTEELGPRGGGPVSQGPRRFSGGLPRWLLADAGSETVSEETSERTEPAEETGARREGELSDDQVAALSGFVEAKHEETQDRAEADTLVGGTEFEEVEARDRFALTHDAEVEEDQDEEEEETENGAIETEEDEEEVVELHEEESDAAHDDAPEEEDDEEEEQAEDRHEERSAAELAEEEADAAHEEAEQIAALGEHAVDEPRHNEGPGNSAAAANDDSILLPGETRAPHVPGERQEFASSARIGGNPRSRFQRPFRGRDRGGRRDNRGGHRDDRGGDRGGRPDRRGGRRFDRRGPGGGGHGHHRGHHGGHSGPPRRPQLISEMLKAGQDVVVQIAKEPLGKKGARITSHVALPGRFLVYMPTIDHIGVSRKIASAENRSRLRRLVGEARGSYPGGFIVRTAAGGATDDEIRADIDFLGKTWNEIKQRFEDRQAPALLHRDLNLVERILRDYVSDDFTGIWIDNEEEYSKVLEFVSRFQPRLANRVKLYTKEQPIFEEFGIQHELDKALRAKVWLKSGGYIVINHTEALVAIDVNTGKFVGKGS
ncbi:MAG TPA: ribonuclease E/G, partial [Candidatus Acidoferrales bacterium]|nr:ribonuclease E/G [Candidatus Acidoferrales bacterium]